MAIAGLTIHNPTNTTDAMIQDALDGAGPAAQAAKLGTTLYNLIAAYNGLEAKYLALLAHLDAANVTGIGNANVATYGGVSTVPLPSTL
jgi:hypothetical protein